MEKNRDRPKEPWFAVVLSSFLAGIGQIYSGRILRGSVLIFVSLTLVCLSFWSWLSPTCDVLISIALPLISLAVWIWNLFDAYRCARQKNPEDFEIERKLSKDPWLALFLSDLIPGLGQIYLKKWLEGILFIISIVIVLVETYNHPLLFISVWAVLSTFVCYRAYVMTPLRRQTSYRTMLIIVIAILCSHLLYYDKHVFREYFIQSMVMQTDPWLAGILPPDVRPYTSMKPTLLPGDKYLIRKTRRYNPKRGDVIVFSVPDDPDYTYVKRIAALPDETLEIKNKILFIDGRQVQHPALQGIENTPRDYFGMEGKPYEVPEDHVFVIGDNSANSRDSRAFGAVPLSDVIGKAYKIYWPLSRRGPIR
jgi:signal peptidase I